MPLTLSWFHFDTFMLAHLVACLCVKADFHIIKYITCYMKHALGNAPVCSVFSKL